MQGNRDEILQAAMKLSETDRLVIANRLMETLPDEFSGLSDADPGLADELERRSGDWDGAVPWEHLRDELRPNI